ncbi:glycoside hydrolase [Planotetraspora sp. A-T 1434]|uniref:sialidase family protein n=1 Tax=Planotetraspora sp. A-T 1434 TaxID=2979219 RepID=UPI0021BF49C4|nr:sialidase family protein [Planotetraspora sp. A-T 1434]MCT9930230.1 glycoside hydrolase [Planotetraspora sp. A-T 1434]
MSPTTDGARAKSWPDADAFGTGVGDPVTVYGTADRDARGELRHEGNRVPDIVALDPLRLVAGWRAGVADPLDPTPTDQGSIMFARSGDGGRTWTTGTLAAATATHRYHYVIFLRDGGTLYALLGRITISEDREPGGGVDGFPVRMVAKRSTDGGLTWADFPIAVDVPDNGRGVVVAGKPLRHGGHWLVPYWRRVGTATRAGVLRSADLATWTSGGLAGNPRDIAIEEPQVVVSHDDPGTLLMVTRTLDLRGGTSPEQKDAYYRTHATYAATATSADGGLTWSPLELDPDLPNYYVKAFLTRDSAGRYLTIYNTLAGPFSGSGADKPDQYREVLHYKVKRPGDPWGPGRLFADCARQTAGAGRGWDVYASADEYEPGKFFVVWEHNQIEIKVARLDVSAGFTGVGAGWGGPWNLTGTAEITSSGRLRLASAGSRDGAGSGTPGAGRPYGPSGAFVATLKGHVTSPSTLDRRTGAGAGLALKVSTGARRLMLAVQPDGVHSMIEGGTEWSRVHAATLDTTAAHLWRVTVDARGNAALFADSADTGARWVVAAAPDAPEVSVWASGTPGRPAEALLDSLEVAETVAATTWDAWGDWRPDPGGGVAELSGGRLRLRSATGKAAQATIALDISRSGDFTLEFRGRVDDDSALNPVTGHGVSLGTKVANGARRLMLAIQRNGVWTIKKGATAWERVHSLNGAGALATWKVTVDSAGVARLYRDGAGTGATWVTQDSRESPQVTHWVAGTPGGNAAEARVEWTCVTCP